MTIKTQIGWVARYKRNPKHFGGHAAKCIVYQTANKALASQRRIYDKETDADVLSEWDILPVYVEEPT